jgi:apolipoprotein N-acyltransferase
MDKMGATDYSLNDFAELSPAEYGNIINTSEEDLNRLKSETKKAIEAGAKVIIWQEFAFHAGSKKASLLIEEMKEEAEAAGVYIVVSFGEVLSPEKRANLPLRNKSVLITPEGTVGWDYSKTKVNPGYEDVIYEAGDGIIPYVDTPFGRMGMVICADGIYQHFIRQAYTKHIDLLLVPSWDSTTSTPKITDCTDIRAVEFGFTSVRIAGEGLSTVSDPYYRRWARQNSFEPSLEELYMDNFYANVPIFSKRTFFGSVGYWLQWLAFILLPALIVWALVKRKKGNS